MTLWPNTTPQYLSGPSSCVRRCGSQPFGPQGVATRCSNRPFPLLRKKSAQTTACSSKPVRPHRPPPPARSRAIPPNAGLLGWVRFLPPSWWPHSPLASLQSCWRFDRSVFVHYLCFVSSLCPWLPVFPLFSIFCAGDLALFPPWLPELPHGLSYLAFLHMTLCQTQPLNTFRVPHLAFAAVVHSPSAPKALRPVALIARSPS